MQNQPITRAGQIILARLLVPAKAGLTAAKVAADLSKLDAERFSADRVAADLEALRDQKQVEVVPPSRPAKTPAATKRPSSKPPPPPKPPAYKLTATGHDTAVRALGSQKLPTTVKWPGVVEALLRVAVEATPQTPPVKTKPALAARLIRRQFDVDAPENAKLPTVIAAVVCKSLGFPGVSDYKALEAKVLAGLIGSPAAMTPASATEQFIRHRLGAKQGKLDEIKAFALRQWLHGDSRAGAESNLPHRDRPPVRHETGATAAPDSADVSLADFARRTIDAARHSDTGWFGDNKVFISHAWRSYRARGNGEGPGDLAQFKQQLIRANTAGLLELSRADLVALMDPDDVRESEARYLNTSFHFILVERGRT